MPELPIGTLHLGICTYAGGLQLCMDTLSVFPCACLTTVVITSLYLNFDREDPTLVSQVSPLLNVSQMRQLHFILPRQTFRLTGEHLCEMGTRWPGIIHLQLIFDSSEEGLRLAPDLYDLRSLCSLCPHLRSLALPVLKVPDTAHNLPAPPTYTNALAVLRVLRLVHPNIHPEAIAPTLNAILGSDLRTIHFLHNPRSDDMHVNTYHGAMIA